MVSPELIRRYPFFAGLKHEFLTLLAQIADETEVAAGDYFFQEHERLDTFYVCMSGEVAIVLPVPAKDVEQKVSGQLTGQLQTSDVVVSMVGAGEVFGWSALIPPHEATASARATKLCQVIAFDSQALLTEFEHNCPLALLLTQRAAQIGRDRLHNQRIEVLAHLAT